MELPQPRAFGAEGGGGGGRGRKATHDFLSLCSQTSTLHQDHPTRLPPPPPPPQSQSQSQAQEDFLMTHDFLGRRTGGVEQQESAPKAMSSSVERPPPPPQSVPIPSSVEHILPGGIGTYSISHISYFTQKLPAMKPETTVASPFAVVQASSTDRTDDNSNCSSYTNSGFTLWEESSGNKGKTGKENVHLATAAVRDSEARLGRWNAPERPAQSTSNNNHLKSSFGSFSSYQQSGQKSKSFMDMIQSAKSVGDPEDELDDGEMEFMLKKESPPAPEAELRVKIDGKSSEQKANTPRSKHSATEQRRRSKINDRFQMLRALIPHSDQKRDRASFLLEVIEYIQLLQDKVTKYEGLYPGWRREPPKATPSRNGQRQGNGFIDQSCPTINGSNPTMVFAPKIDEDNDSMTSGNPRSGHNPSDADVSSATALKANAHPIGIGNVFPFPISLHPNHSSGARSGRQVAHVSHGVAAGFDCKPWTAEYAAALNNKLKEEELTVEGGSISFSNVYSHGLLNTLTQALQSSGVDLSQASISVKIELGKSGNLRTATTSQFPKDMESAAASKVQCIPRTRAGTEDSDQALKKLKTCKVQV